MGRLTSVRKSLGTDPGGNCSTVTCSWADSAATCSLAVTILTEDGIPAHVELPSAGKRPDKRYPVSKVAIGNGNAHSPFDPLRGSELPEAGGFAIR